MLGGTILAWDSLSVSPVPVPALGLCNSGQLATNLLSLPARHQVSMVHLEVEDKVRGIATSYAIKNQLMA